MLFVDLLCMYTLLYVSLDFDSFFFFFFFFLAGEPNTLENVRQIIQPFYRFGHL